MTTCPKCDSELPQKARFCSKCGHQIESKSLYGAEPVVKPLAGFRRTLSTEFLEKEIESRVLKELNELVERRRFTPGETIIAKGETNRDLLFLTEGAMEIFTPEEGEELLLNEVEAPYILGDIAFLSGFPRTATARAKTEVEVFLLKYENLRSLFKEFPEWLQPLLTSIVSGIKSLHYSISELKKESSQERDSDPHARTPAPSRPFR